MDLYGDLPPIGAEKDSWKDSSSQSGSLSETKSLSLPVPTVETREAGTSQEGVKAKPNNKPFSATLLFKPRQTSKIHNALSASSGVKTSAPSDNQNTVSTIQKPVSASEPSIVRETNSQENSQEQHKEEEEEEPELFNTNSSFDVEGQDSYDPMRPNDYLTFCQEREEMKRLAKLAEDNQRTLEEMERQRREKERERQLAAESGDFQKLLATATAATNSHSTTSISNNTNPSISGGVTMGRGRGRGVMNLPAWITQQMSSDLSSSEAVEKEREGRRDLRQDVEEKKNNVEEEPTVLQASLLEPQVGMKRKAVSSFSKVSRVLLLQNMVSLEEAMADGEELAKETREECERFGRVLDCEVFLAKRTAFPELSDQMRVRIFVRFERQDASIRALKELNGRFFGGRQVTASFFEEEAFLQRQLAPSVKS
eukprot:gene7399-8185_t